MTSTQLAPKQPARKPAKKEERPALTDWLKVAEAKRALYEYWKDQFVGIFDGIYIN